VIGLKRYDGVIIITRQTDWVPGDIFGSDLHWFPGARKRYVAKECGLRGCSFACVSRSPGHFNLLILVGAGGLAKSRSVRAVLNGKACWIEGNATPFGMHGKLYRHRDEFVVIDDVDALHGDRSGGRVLKCLCQTEEEKSRRLADHT
jgi:hypothetical protein